MTIEDFNAKRLAYRRSQVVPGLVFFALLGIAGIVTIFAGKRIDHVGLDYAGGAIIAVSYLVIALLMYYILAWVPRRRLVELGLTCPKCGTQLNGRNSGVTAAGRCRSCGTQVLESK